MGAPRHGINGLIYVSGQELTGGNSWNVNITQDNEEVRIFGDTWANRLVGGKAWQGSVSAYDMGDEKIIKDAAVSGLAVALLIYPSDQDLATYYSGNAIFGMDSSGGANSAITEDGDFVGNSTLTMAGWT